MNRLRIGLWIQIAFFVAWALYLTFLHKGGREIWLETRPVDPRDLISGHYVALSYAIGNPVGPGCPDLNSANATGRYKLPPSLYVELTRNGKYAKTKDGSVEIWDVQNCSDLPIESADQVFAHGSLNPQPFGDMYRYGIEKYFVSENSPMRNAVSGSVVAKVSVNAQHQLRILELVETVK